MNIISNAAVLTHTIHTSEHTHAYVLVYCTATLLSRVPPVNIIIALACYSVLLMLVVLICCLPVQLRRRTGVKQPMDTSASGIATPTPSRVSFVDGQKSSIELVPIG